MNLVCKKRLLTDTFYYSPHYEVYELNYTIEQIKNRVKLVYRRCSLLLQAHQNNISIQFSVLADGGAPTDLDSL